MKEEKNIKKEIPQAIRKTRLKGETKMSKRNRKMLEIIRAFRAKYE